ncbi:hypothetical protein CYY_000224 [Polysphondylium violaceum]|uniref:FNIP repeat-containing protein n=1 Tax=Polysphondylium violaceum TaxID=133409 RepID=A0A8J4Q555_9MYCE|nr:hypothetical protein CYY_000224 [Polysphondylium violaceum]
MNSFFYIFRNLYLRPLIRNNVFKDTIIDIPSLEYLNDNHQYLSVFSNDDKLKYNINIRLIFTKNNTSQLDQFRNNRHKHLINEIELQISGLEVIDFSIVHDQVHRFSFYLEEKTKRINGKLPDSIIELNIGANPISNFVCLPLEEILLDLPKNLQILKLSDRFKLSSCSTSKIQLPNSIIALDYRSKSADLDRFITTPPNKVLKGACLKVLNDGDFHWVQDKQWLDSLYIEMEVPSQIPAHIKKINFFTSSFGSVDAVIELLPSQLEWLDASRLTSHLNIPIQNLFIQYLPSLKHLNLMKWPFDKALFPETLESLKIFGFNNVLYPGALPPNLKTLDLSKFNQQLEIGSLPNSVTNLSLDSYNQPLRAFVLPTQLKRLSLFNFTNNIEPNSLPLSLKRLYLNNFDGSFEHLGKLHNLRELSVFTINQSMVDALANTKKIKINFKTIQGNTTLANTSITDLSLENSNRDISIIPRYFLPLCVGKLELTNLDIRSIDTIPPSCVYFKYTYKQLNTDLIPKSIKNIYLQAQHPILFKYTK